MLKYFIIFVLAFFSLKAFSDQTQKVNRKTQKVDFESETIDGQARTPDGSYVVQKRGVDFVPLYKVRENFDESIRQSAHYLK